jgi:CheY-like chemotaxis protein
MSESARPSVLVVHENPTATDCPTDLLRERYDVEVATDESEALESLHDDLDVAILDSTSTGADDIDLVERIRRARVDCQVAVLRDARETSSGGREVETVVPKSADSTELRETVERLCALAAYEETQRTLSSLRVRRNVRRMELSREQQRSDADYRELCARIDELEAELADLRETIDDPELLERVEG